MKRWMGLVLAMVMMSGIWAAAEPIVVFLPTKNIVATRSVYMVKGRVNNVSALKIDGKVATYNAKGGFSFPLSVKKVNEPQTVTFKVLTDDYRVVTFSRQIYFESKVSPKIAGSVKELTHPESEKRNTGLVSKKVTKSKIKLSQKKASLPKPSLKNAHPVLPSVKKESSLNSGGIPAVDSDVSIQPIQMIETTISQPTGSLRTLPTVFVKNPQNNMVTYESKISIEGQVRYCREFFINNRSIKVDNEGRFKEDFPLPDVGKFVFNLYAMGDAGLSTTVIRKVFRIDHEEPTSMVKPVSRLVPIQTDVQSKMLRKVSIDLEDAEVSDVIRILADKGDLNIVSDKSLVGTTRISLTNVTIQDALDYILSTQGLAYKIIEGTILIGTQENLDRATRLETKVIRLDNIDAKSVAGILNEHLKVPEKVQFEDQENVIILNADSKKIQSLVDLVAKLDEKKQAQIILEAQFLEVNQTSLENLGLAWSNAYGLGAAGSLSDGAFTYVSNMSISTILNLLQNKGDAKILAKPRIKAVDKEPAEIFIGDSIPYIELTSDSVGKTQQSVKFIQSGVLLKILPEINTYTQEIKIKFEPQVSYVNGFGGPNNDIPIVRERRVSTVVNIHNGQTVLIGGLFNSSDSDTHARFPLLSKIPVLGVFFRTTKTQKDQTELVIAVTPRIIDENYVEVTGNVLESSKVGF